MLIFGVGRCFELLSKLFSLLLSSTLSASLSEVWGTALRYLKACPCLSQPCSWFKKRHHQQEFLLIKTRDIWPQIIKHAAHFCLFRCCVLIWVHLYMRTDPFRIIFFTWHQSQEWLVEKLLFLFINSWLSKNRMFRTQGKAWCLFF